MLSWDRMAGIGAVPSSDLNPMVVNSAPRAVVRAIDIRPPDSTQCSHSPASLDTSSAGPARINCEYRQAATSSILLGCRIGRSPGFSPVRIRPVSVPPCGSRGSSRRADQASSPMWPGAETETA
jgi:hypothetical protein